MFEACEAVSADVGFRVQVSGLRVQSSRFRVLGPSVKGLRDFWVLHQPDPIARREQDFHALRLNGG